MLPRGRIVTASTNMARSLKGHYGMISGIKASLPPHLIEDKYITDALNYRVRNGVLAEVPPFFVTVVPNATLAVITNILSGGNTGLAGKLILLDEANNYSLTTDLTTVAALRRISGTVFTGAGVGEFSWITFGGNFSGATFKVVVQAGGATYKWQANAGPLSAAIPFSESEVELIVNGITVRFYATSGFTATDQWVATFTAAAYGTSTVATQQAVVIHSSGVFVSAFDKDIQWMDNTFFQPLHLSVDPNGAGAVRGRYMTAFYEHLVVSNNVLGPFHIQWSDLFDFTNFVPTDTNEADFFDLQIGGSLNSASLGITGQQLIGPNLYFYTESSIYRMSYVGLPLVMQTVQAVTDVGSIFSFGVVSWNNLNYFWAQDGAYVYDGGSVAQPIGLDIRDRFFADLNTNATKRNATYGWVNPLQSEIIWAYCSIASTSAYPDKEIIFNYKDNTWMFASRGQTVAALAETASHPSVFGGYAVGSVIEREWVTGDGAAAAYPGSYVETKDFVYPEGAIAKVDVDRLAVDFSGTRTLPVFLATRDFIGSAVAWVYQGLAATDPASGAMDLPHCAGRVFRYRVGQTPIGATGSPPSNPNTYANYVLTGLGAMVTNQSEQ